MRYRIRENVSLRLLLSCFVIIMVHSLKAQVVAEPDGFAAYAGTTGGGDSKQVTVSTVADFKTAVKGNDPSVIVVNGMLNVGSVFIGSNKTIIGSNTSSGLYGGGIMVQGENCIIQNLIIGPSDGDAMELSGATKIFIHKCVFHDSKDELCSVVRE